MSLIRTHRLDWGSDAETSSMPHTVEELRELASWYRAFADRAGNPAIWEARLLTARDLEDEADRLEADLTARRARRA
jgi:hypothetical protein